MLLPKICFPLHKIFTLSCSQSSVVRRAHYSGWAIILWGNNHL